METEKLYPTLPSAPPLPQGNDYRMQEITKYRDTIQATIDKYENLLKKKKRAFNVLHYINSTSNGISGMLGATSIVILALGISGVGIPVVSVGLSAGVTSLITSGFLKKMVTKIKKYEKLLQNAKSSYCLLYTSPSPRD